MSGPSIAELRAVCQPESVRGRAGAEHWVAHAYLRRISPYLTRWLLRLGLSANAVTWLMVFSGALAAVATAWPVLAGAVLAALAVQAQMLFDCSDGEVARWRRTSSPMGVYLDRVGHYVAECGIALALGVRVAGGVDPGNPALLGGAVLALLVALNKVENDLVHVARAQAGMAAMRDAEDVRVPRSGGLRRLRGLARLLPFHRAFHSVEASILVLVAALVDAVAGFGAGGSGPTATGVLLVALLVAAAMTVVGHLAAVLTSARLR